MVLNILMVAEKPSLAESIAKILSNGKMKTRKGYATPVHEYQGEFKGKKAFFKMTSVTGHVYTLDFPREFNNWDTVKPEDLFGAPVMKIESDNKSKICRHLQEEAKGMDLLILWLDCDREGENICFEVIKNTKPFMKKSQKDEKKDLVKDDKKEDEKKGGKKEDKKSGEKDDKKNIKKEDKKSGEKDDKKNIKKDFVMEEKKEDNIYRARFSAIAKTDIQKAMNNLVRPNKNESDAVDVRQELDLKIGCAFTRFQTKFFHGKYGNLDTSVISYGPCQTPTLAFCVARHDEILSFVPKPFWSLTADIQHSVGRTIKISCSRGRFFAQNIAIQAEKKLKENSTCKVVKVSNEKKSKKRPNGLNTVDLLKIASKNLGIGPHETMGIAERLYIQGYISYPRTESTKYPSSFNFTEIFDELAVNNLWYAVFLRKEICLSGSEEKLQDSNRWKRPWRSSPNVRIES